MNERINEDDAVSSPLCLESEFLLSQQLWRHNKNHCSIPPAFLLLSSGSDVSSGELEPLLVQPLMIYVIFKSTTEYLKASISLITCSRIQELSLTPLFSRHPLPTHIRPIARSWRFSLLHNSQISWVSSVSFQPFLISLRLLDQPDSLLQALEIQPILQASPVNLCKSNGVNPSLQLPGALHSSQIWPEPSMGFRNLHGFQPSQLVWSVPFRPLGPSFYNAHTLSCFPGFPRLFSASTYMCP